MAADPAPPKRPVPDRTPRPDDRQPTRPRGGRRPYPVDDPGISSPDRPGAEPDYLPDGPRGLPENPPRI
jgi:hypothetical protein